MSMAKLVAAAFALFQGGSSLQAQEDGAIQAISITVGEAPQPVVAPNVRLELDTSVGKFYRVERSSDLMNWQAEGYAFEGTGRRTSVLVSNHGLPRLFYRVRDNATVAELSPVVPYSSVARSDAIGNPPVVSREQIDPAKDRLLFMMERQGGLELRGMTFAELTALPGFATRWGMIGGNLPDQPDLAAALDSKFSALNPPAWQNIIGRPASLAGYGITDAVSISQIGFMDRFARYAENSVIQTGRTLPEYGKAWRFNLTGKTRMGVRTISVDATDSSFNDSANGFLNQWLVPGDWLNVSGFTNASNNGRFVVTGVTAGKITVTRDNGEAANLVGEGEGSLVNLVGGYPPMVSNGALRAADKTLMYVGAPVKSVNGRFSMSMEVELKPSLYPAGIYPPAITIGVKSSEMLHPQGGMSLGNPIHCSITPAGIHANEIYGQPEPLSWDGGGNHPLPFVPGKYFERGVKYLIHIVVEGEEMRVSALGGTRIYRDPRFLAMIGDPETHWFYETGGDSLGNNLYSNVWHLHRIWVNAPELDRAEGWGLPATQNDITVPAGWPLPLSPPSSVNRVEGRSGTDTLLTSIAGQLLANPGTHEKITLHGNFPDTSPKSLALHVDGHEIWNSGGLTESGEWSLAIDRVRQDAASYQFHLRFESETTRRFGFRHVPVMGSGGSPIDVRATMADDSDVVVRAVLRSGPFR